MIFSGSFEGEVRQQKTEEKDEHPILNTITYYFNGPHRTSQALSPDEEALYSTIKKYFE